MCSLLIAPAKCNLITAPGPAPQVPLRQGSGVGGTGEDVGGVVGGTSTGWAERVRGSANPL